MELETPTAANPERPTPNESSDVQRSTSSVRDALFAAIERGFGFTPAPSTLLSRIHNQHYLTDLVVAHCLRHLEPANQRRPVAVDAITCSKTFGELAARLDELHSDILFTSGNAVSQLLNS